MNITVTMVITIMIFISQIEQRFHKRERDLLAVMEGML